MAKLKLISSVILLIILTNSCSTLVIKKNIQNNELAICLSMATEILEQYQSDIDSVTNVFIADHNSKEDKVLTLISCSNNRSRALYLDVLSIKVTSPLEQAAGVAITTLGILTPIMMISANLPFYITFAYLPQSSLQLDMRLSHSISDYTDQRINKNTIGADWYFGSMEDHERAMLRRYYNRLSEEIQSFEDRIKSK